MLDTGVCFHREKKEERFDSEGGKDDLLPNKVEWCEAKLATQLNKKFSVARGIRNEFDN